MNLGWERTALLNERSLTGAAHVLKDVASGVQVTKVDCPGFRGPI
jgi:hypothetical protein